MLSEIQSVGRWLLVCIITVHVSIIQDMLFQPCLCWSVHTSPCWPNPHCWLNGSLGPRCLSANSCAPIDPQDILMFCDGPRGLGGFSRISGLLKNVHNTFYYFHTLLALGSPHRAGSTCHVHTANSIGRSYCHPELYPGFSLHLDFPHWSGFHWVKKTRYRVPFFRHSPSCNSPHYQFGDLFWCRYVWASACSQVKCILSNMLYCLHMYSSRFLSSELLILR